MTTTPPEKTAPKSDLTSHCPVCKERQMVKHCNDVKAPCTWAHCKNKKCDAMLDFKRRIGNALDGATKRFRLHFVDGKWVTRPDGPA